MLAEGLVVHEEVDDVAVLGVALQPAEILLSGERPLAPAPVGEPECDVVAELVVPEKEPEAFLPVIDIDVVRASPSEDVLCAFGKHCIESELVNPLPDGIGVDELGIPE